MPFIRCISIMSLLLNMLLGLYNMPIPAIAPDHTEKCTFSVSSNSTDKGSLFDGKRSTVWTADDAKGFVTVTFPKDMAVTGIYIMWNSLPESWTLEAAADDGEWQEVSTNDSNSYLNAYVPLHDGFSEVRVAASGNNKLSIAEIRTFGPGALPQDVQVWQPAPQKADLMVIAAHPDDEHLYFGGTLPHYAGQLGKRTVVVYMTSSPSVRKFEALDGLWKVGVREYPVFFPLANKYTSTLEEAELAWGSLDHTVDLLVEQFRKYRPDVVVTHDLDGEYGHGAHKLTARAVTLAVTKAGNPAKQPAAKAVAWQVQKCYLHLYDKNSIKLNWRMSLPMFDGSTALEMAEEGYAIHVSQHFRERPVLDSGKYDNSLFGLYHTEVGPDVSKSDFFENIQTAPPPTATPMPTPTAAATDAGPASPASESLPAMAAVAKDMRASQNGFTIMRVILVLGGIAMVLFILWVNRQPAGWPFPPDKNTVARSRGRLRR